MNVTVLLLYVVMFGAMYMFLIHPQKKRKKQLETMRAELKVGDNIITVGGIVGKVSGIKEDNITIEVGVERTKLEIKKWGIYNKEIL